MEKKNLATPRPVFRATGYRKRAIAQAVMVQGTGKIRVNTVPVEQFIVDKILLQDLLQGLTCTKTSTMFDVWIKVRGGGFAGQVGACRLAIARALIKADASYKPILRQHGLVTRDARIKERKKYGLKKARRAPQFSKR